MSSTTQKLMEKGLATDAPSFLKTNVHYETIMGSHAYGVADTSVKAKIPDYDVLRPSFRHLKNLVFKRRYCLTICEPTTHVLCML